MSGRWRRSIACAVLASGGTSCDCNPSPTSGSTLSLPDELADERALALFAGPAALAHFNGGQYTLQSSGDASSNNDFNRFVCAGQDATASLARGVPQCSEPFVRGLVLARFEGSGHMARLWLTSSDFARGRTSDAALLLYIDDNSAPRATIPLKDLYPSDSASEIVGPPFNTGGPASQAIAWHYPVVFNRSLVVALDGAVDGARYFHQTAVVLDSVPSRRYVPGARLAARGDAITTLREPRSPGSSLERTVTIAPGSGSELELSAPGTVTNWTLELSKDDLEALDEVRLQVRWDEEAEPSIDLPLLELFMSALGARVEGTSSPSLTLAQPSSGPIVLSFRLPMSFRHRATFRFSFPETSERSPVDMRTRFTLLPVLPHEPWGYLNAQAHVTRTPATEHVLADIRPRRAGGMTSHGKLVGVCAHLEGRSAGEVAAPERSLEYLEGDDELTIDGGAPQRGTGTEDYFDSAFWFAGGSHASAFSQVWDIVPHRDDDAAHGSVRACRWHLYGDAIEFDRSLHLALELGPNAPETLDEYRSVAFFYR